MFSARYELTDALVAAIKTDQNEQCNEIRNDCTAVLSCNCNCQCTVCVTKFKLLLKKQHIS